MDLSKYTTSSRPRRKATKHPTFVSLPQILDPKEELDKLKAAIVASGAPKNKPLHVLANEAIQRRRAELVKMKENFAKKPILSKSEQKGANTNSLSPCDSQNTSLSWKAIFGQTLEEQFRAELRRQAEEAAALHPWNQFRFLLKERVRAEQQRQVEDQEGGDSNWSVLDYSRSESKNDDSNDK